MKILQKKSVALDKQNLNAITSAAKAMDGTAKRRSNLRRKIVAFKFFGL
jgi:hypothetical protein